MARPLVQRLPESPGIRPIKPPEHIHQRPYQIRRRGAVLQLDERRHPILRRQILGAERLRVNQHVALRGLAACQEPVRRGDRLPHLHRRRPAPLTVVDHDGQHRRQRTCFAQHPVADQLLMHQGGIGQDARRHAGIHRRLKLQHHQQPPRVAVRRRVAKADAPQHVAEAPAQVVADVLGGKPLQGGEIERLDPIAGDEPAHEVCDHPRQGEQQLVEGIVHRPTIAPPRARRSRRNAIWR